MDLGLQGRAVIVTGGSGGIGAVIARSYGAEGADVAVAYHQNRDAAEAVAPDAAKGGGRTVSIHHELADPASAANLAAAVLAEFGRIDVLVNNAVNWGLGGPELQPPQRGGPGGGVAAGRPAQHPRLGRQHRDHRGGDQGERGPLTSTFRSCSQPRRCRRVRTHTIGRTRSSGRKLAIATRCGQNAIVIVPNTIAWKA